MDKKINWYLQVQMRLGAFGRHPITRTMSGPVIDSDSVFKAMLAAAPTYLENKANDLEPRPQPPHSEE